MALGPPPTRALTSTAPFLSFFNTVSQKISFETNNLLKIFETYMCVCVCIDLVTLPLIYDSINLQAWG